MRGEETIDPGLYNCAKTEAKCDSAKEECPEIKASKKGSIKKKRERIHVPRSALEARGLDGLW